MDAVAPTAEHPDRVDGGHEEPGDEIRRQDHVRNLVGHRRVEDHLQRLDRRDVARRRREPLRLVHPRVHGHDRERAAEARDHDRHPRPEVGPRREVLPAEDVDRDEDRLEEEEDALDREQHAEHLAEASGERRPEEPELEGEDGPGHGADRERHRHHLRPALRELQRVGDRCGAGPGSWRPASSNGSATPSDARMMWKPSVNAIWLLAASSVEAKHHHRRSVRWFTVEPSPQRRLAESPGSMTIAAIPDPEGVRRAGHRLDREAPPVDIGPAVARERASGSRSSSSSPERRLLSIAAMTPREAVVVALEIGEAWSSFVAADGPRLAEVELGPVHGPGADGIPRSSRAGTVRAGTPRSDAYRPSSVRA